MKIITDSSSNLAPERAAELGIEVIPMQVTFMGQSYRDVLDISTADILRLYAEHPEEYSTTSQPAIGYFTSVYQKFAGEEILSIHLSSGLSGTYATASAAAQMLPEQKITVVDSKTLGPGLGWMAELAVRAAHRGWSKERIIAAMQRLRDSTIEILILEDVRYLVRSGRVSHLRGMMASMLHIKPLLTVDYSEGRFKALGQQFSVEKLVQRVIGILKERYGDQSLRMQVFHGANLPGVGLLRSALAHSLTYIEDPLLVITSVLAAHGGASILGLATAPQAAFDEGG